MFAEFDESMFPTIKVILHEGPNNDTDYDSFIYKWLELYDNQKDFTFLFDTTNMKNEAKLITGAFDLKAHVQKTLNRKLHSFSAK